MSTKFRNAALIALLLGSGALVSAEVVEEETWYNADGEVVKKVTRTYTGADAVRTPDWEPAWVARERQSPARVVRYSPGRTYWGGSYHGRVYYGSGWIGGCRSYSPRPRGFSGFYNSGHSSGSRWGVSYSAPGFTLRYRD